MPKMAMTEVTMERGLLDMPYEVLFEIFCKLPKSKLIGISRLCSKLKDVAGDIRLWKDVTITYDSTKYSTVFAFDDLYSEPWPVKEINMTDAKIKPPVRSNTDQVVKVFKLNLSSITANKVTMEAILTKYQCTELSLDFNSIDLQGRIMGIEPETFSKQTDLQVLSLIETTRKHTDVKSKRMIQLPCHLWLAPVLDNCKNLKGLSLSYNNLSHPDMMGFVRNLPTSLEKLSIVNADPEDSFFESLAESTPNLKVLALCFQLITNCPSLLKFQFLEILYIHRSSFNREHHEVKSDFHMYLMKFPALKTVYTDNDWDFRNLPTMLQPHGIIVRPIRRPEASSHPQDCNSWKISKST